MVDFIGPGFAEGVERAFSMQTIAYCTLGVTMGMIVGILPGVGVLATIALLMPITFYLDPLSAIAMLAGIYYGATYGGSTASILLNLPGTAATSVTCLDGYPMTRQGRGAVALFITTIASFVGSLFGIAILAVFAFPLASVALEFTAREYFSLMLLGLVAAATMSPGAPLKSLSMVALGLLAGIVGIDVTSGVARFTFSNINLYDGLSLVAIALGLFGLSELLRQAGQLKETKLSARDVSFQTMLPTRDDWRRSAPAMLRGTGLGSFFGALPGVGGTIASFVSYAVERRISKTPERFGNGAIEGISGPESANNAAIQTAFIPTLTLGIPGDAVMALMLGVFMIHGITPGPQLMANEPGLFWGLVITFLFGNLVLLILNIPLIGIWIRVLTIPYSILFPGIMGFLCIGVYSVNYSVVDLYVLIAFGMAGYLFFAFRFPIAPMLLGFILGPMMEEYFRRAMLLQRGDPLGFFQRPLSAIFLTVTVFLLVYMAFAELRKHRRGRAAGTS